MRGSWRKDLRASWSTRHEKQSSRVFPTESQRPRFRLPAIHWTGGARVVGWYQEAWSRTDTEEGSGQPEAKATPARVEPVEFAWRGFARSARAVQKGYLVGTRHATGHIGRLFGE